MTDTESFDGTGDWQRFVIDHGYGASGFDLAAVLQRPITDIVRIRATGACAKLRSRKSFADLFRLRHGHEPLDDEWPRPRKQGGRPSYEWLGPELALLATLVGRLSKEEIAQVLTKRLRDITRDPTAIRNPVAVQVAINMIGMQSSDVLSGITTAKAGREIGSLAIINQAIHKGDIRAVRVGRLWVIPYETWKTWKSKRILPPTGYVPLAKLKGSLSIHSDKLSEFARLGYVPTAIRCNPYGAGASTQFGTWYLNGDVANRLIADRHAGQPMPWHGKPLTDNLRATYKLWQDRKHPTTCKTCAAIWGSDGAPKDFNAYVRRYPPLAHGAKRHLTMIWSAGLTVRQVAKQASCSEKHVWLAAANGALDASYDTGRMRVSRTEATRWISGGCSSGDSRRSWISLATARKRYLFTMRELMDLIAQRKLKSRTGTDGAARRRLRIFATMCLPSQRERLHRARSGTACPCNGTTISRCAGGAELAQDRRDTAQHRAGRHQAPAVESRVLHRAGSARTRQID